MPIRNNVIPPFYPDTYYAKCLLEVHSGIVSFGVDLCVLIQTTIHMYMSVELQSLAFIHRAAPRRYAHACLRKGALSRITPAPTLSSRESSSDRRLGAVSPSGRRSIPQQREKPVGGNFGIGSGAVYKNNPASKALVTQLVRGHTGSVMALAVFEGMQEYATGGYDRCSPCQTLYICLVIFSRILERPGYTESNRIREGVW